MTNSPKAKDTLSQPFADEVKKDDSKRTGAQNERITQAEQFAPEQKAAVVDKAHRLAR